jgi:hypothetical protein
MTNGGNLVLGKRNNQADLFGRPRESAASFFALTNRSYVADHALLIVGGAQ